MADIRQAFEYASQNPDSDFAKNLATMASSGALDIEAKQNGIDLTPFKPEPVKQKENFGDKVANEQLAGVNKIKDSVTSGANNLQKATTESGLQRVKDIGLGLGQAAFGTITGAAQTALAPVSTVLSPVVDKITHPDYSPELQAKLDQKNKDLGIDTLKQKAQELSSKHPESATLIGDILNTALLAAGGNPVKNSIQSGLENQTLKGAVKDTASGITKAVTPDKIAKATDLISSTEATLTKGERQAAIDQGRATVSKLGKTVYNPTVTEQRAGELLAGKLKSNPVKNVPTIKNEISSRGAEAEKFLTDNTKPISATEQGNMFKSVRDKMAKYSTKSELKAYDEQTKMFTKLIVGKGGFDTANFYKALKEYETNIASKLARGKEALLDPTGAASAKLQAAKDIRKVVRDKIGEIHPEFKTQMFDLASLYDALDNTIIKAEKTGGNILTRTAKKYPTATKVGAGVAAGLLGSKYIK